MHHGNATTCCEGLVTQSRLVSAPPRAPGPMRCHISCQIYHCGQNCLCIANSVTIILLVTGIVLTVLISLFFPVHNAIV